MRRALVISLSLVLALVGWDAVCADDFFIIPVTRGKYAPVPKTGQAPNSVAGSDGNLQKGVPWPTPRFADNNNGTVTDKLTGLIWMKNANAFSPTTWGEAITIANNLHAGSIQGLDDGSTAGDWRLPNVRELQSLVDYGRYYPALPENHPFTGVPWGSYYWSSTTFTADPELDGAFDVAIGGNGIADPINKTELDYVLCVRGGK